MPPLAPRLGVTQVWPGRHPLVKRQLNWTHVERTHRCPCARAISDGSGACIALKNGQMQFLRITRGRSWPCLRSVGSIITMSVGLHHDASPIYRVPSVGSCDERTHML
jgi:hypothetical protein